MAERAGALDGHLHERGADAKRAMGAGDRQRAKQQSGLAASAHVPQPHGADQLAAMHSAQSKAVRRQAPGAKQLAGLGATASAQRRIEQKLACWRIRRDLRAQNERRESASLREKLRAGKKGLWNSGVI